jgi:putative oxidoreductase
MTTSEQSGDSLPKSRVMRAYLLFAAAACWLQSPLLLAVRLYWGWQFHVTGAGKLKHIDKTAAFFQSIHISHPTLNAWLAGSAECLCGLLLVLGLATRLACLPLIFTMIVAYATAESEVVKHIFNDPDKFVSSAPFLFLLASLVVLAFGPGAFSLDWLIRRSKCRGK